MKALCVSDKVIDWIYSTNITQNVNDVDVIFGCGDLPYYYLEYILTMLNKPLYYVHGNHDPEQEYTPSGEAIFGPGGGQNLDGRVLHHNGLLFAGLEGSVRYKNEGSFQYTEAEMWRKAFKLGVKLSYQRLFTKRPLDVLIAHSPPLGIHNGHDHVHRGFESFLWLMRYFRPRFLLHGHHHVYRRDEQTVTQYHNTTVINIYPHKIIELGDAI